MIKKLKVYFLENIKIDEGLKPQKHTHTRTNNFAHHQLTKYVKCKGTLFLRNKSRKTNNMAKSPTLTIEP